LVSFFPLPFLHPPVGIIFRYPKRCPSLLGFSFLFLATRSLPPEWAVSPVRFLGALFFSCFSPSLFPIQGDTFLFVFFLSLQLFFFFLNCALFFGLGPFLSPRIFNRWSFSPCFVRAFPFFREPSPFPSHPFFGFSAAPLLENFPLPARNFFSFYSVLFLFPRFLFFCGGAFFFPPGEIGPWPTADFPMRSFFFLAFILPHPGVSECEISFCAPFLLFPVGCFFPHRGLSKGPERLQPLPAPFQGIGGSAGAFFWVKGDPWKRTRGRALLLVLPRI